MAYGNKDLKRKNRRLYILAMVNVAIWAISLIAMVFLAKHAPIVKKLYPILAGGAGVGISIIATISKAE